MIHSYALLFQFSPTPVIQNIIRVKIERRKSFYNYINMCFLDIAMFQIVWRSHVVQALLETESCHSRDWGKDKQNNRNIRSMKHEYRNSYHRAAGLSIWCSFLRYISPGEADSGPLEREITKRVEQTFCENIPPEALQSLSSMTVHSGAKSFRNSLNFSNHYLIQFRKLLNCRNENCFLILSMASVREVFWEGLFSEFFVNRAYSC